MADLTDRQRYVLEMLNGRGHWYHATSSQIGRRVQEHFGVRGSHQANSRRFGTGLTGLNVLKSLEQRGFVEVGYTPTRSAQAWWITPAGRKALHG